MSASTSLFRRFLCVIVLSFLAAAPPVSAGPKAVAVDWSPHGAKRGCRMNMGGTGALAWMRGYQFQVVHVDAGSPADGVLLPGDLVVGAGGTTFKAEGDSRMTLGKAIGTAEAKGGELKLVIRRNGRKKRVEVQLPVTGAFAKGWPYGCAKSQRILHDACQYLMAAQQPDGEWPSDGGIATFTSGLLLLSTGEARFMDAARRAAHATAAMDLVKIDYHSWAMGYGGMLLAEYYLATGDDTVLEELQSVCDHLAKGQMHCGSWGHKGPSGGYGAMNQAGVVCTITLSLAKECGLKVNEETLQRALTFYGRYGELGAVPYGDHLPGSSRPDDNGKSASSAVLCSLHPEWHDAASAFARSVAISYWLRETGHTGGFFSMVWGPIAADMAGGERFGTFMEYQDWYYTLSRTWRGGLMMLPYHEALTRFDDSSYAWWGDEYTTGALALAFAVPRHRLRIFGAPRSVFGAEIDGPLLEARDAYQGRDWGAFDAAVGAAGKTVKNATGQQYLAQLQAAAGMLKASTERTEREIENNIDEGDPYRAEEQYLALKRFLGDDDETVKALDERMVQGHVQWHKKSGKQYYDALRSMRGVSVMSWVPYGETSKVHMGDTLGLRPRFWESLVPVCGETPREWSAEGEGSAVAGEIVFELGSTDYEALRLRLRAVRPAHTRVRINGVPVANIVRGLRSGYAKIDLDASALGLLREGRNTIAVKSTSGGRGNNALDVGLDGVRREDPLPPVSARAGDDRPDVPETPACLLAALDYARREFLRQPVDEKPNPAVPERLRVRDSMNRFRSALGKAFDEFSYGDLDTALRSPVAYWRFLATQSLGRRGDRGLAIAVAGLGDDDWRVRSACCDALGARKADLADRAETTVLLTGLLGDDVAWVRTRAAKALGAIGRQDPAAAAALATLAADADQWARTAALGALGKVAGDPQVMVAAAREALLIQSTAFSAIGRAMALIEKSEAADESLLPSLLFVIDNPAEGMGAQRFNSVLKLLAELDPEGEESVQAIAKVAAGGYGYDRLRGNPRKTAIEVLGEMGPKAKGAIPTLEKILAGTDEKAQQFRDAAKVSLEKIQGTAGE